MAGNQERSQQRKFNSTMTLVVGALSVFASFALITAVYIVSTEHHARVAYQQDLETYKKTSRFTTLYIGDGSRVEKWDLDIETGRRKYLCHISWQEAYPEPAQKNRFSSFRR